MDIKEKLKQYIKENKEEKNILSKFFKRKSSRKDYYKSAFVSWNNDASVFSGVT